MYHSSFNSQQQRLFGLLANPETWNPGTLGPAVGLQSWVTLLNLTHVNPNGYGFA